MKKKEPNCIQYRFVMIAMMVFLSTAAMAESDQSPTPTQKAAKAVLLSWDGAAEWITEQLLDEGKLPHLAQLKAQGAAADYVISSFPLPHTTIAHAAIWTGAPDYINGIRVFTFSSERLKAEPIWITAAKYGLSSVLLDVSYSTPIEPYTTGRKYGANFNDLLTIFSGYTRLLAPAGMIREEVGIAPANGWHNMPEHIGENKEIRFNILDSTFFGLFFNSPHIPVDGFDSLLLTQSKQWKTGDGIVLEPGISPPGTTDKFKKTWVIHNNQNYPIYFRLFRLEKDGSQFRLYHTSISDSTITNRPDLLREYEQSVGGIIETRSTKELYGFGAFGPRIVEGGDGTAEKCFLEVAHLVMQHGVQAVQFAIKRLDWSLMITYTPLPDVAGHAWVGLVDPINGTDDAEIAQQIWPYLTAFYQLADKHLGAIMSQLSPDVTIAVVSDHGMRGYRKIFSPKKVLLNAGLLSTAGPFEQIIKEKSKAYPDSNRNNLFIRINKEIVPPEEKQQVAEQVIEALWNAKDPETNRSIVTAVIDLERLGPSIGLIDIPADFYIVVKPGYMCADVAPSHQGYVQNIPLTAVSTAEHTSLPDDPALHAIFYVSGPGVKKNQKDMMPIRSIDIAPTICHILGLPPPAQAIGRVVNEILE